MASEEIERGACLDIVLVSRCFVKREDGKLLLIKRSSDDSHNPGKWEGPGGKLEKGEDLTRALENEVMEETRLVVQPLYPIAFHDSYVIGDEGKYLGFSYAVIFGIAKTVGGSKVALSEEHVDHVWVTYEELLAYDLTLETRKAATHLEEHLKG